MPKYDLVIRNGTIVDGTGNDRFQGDLAVADGKIVAIGNIENATSDLEIDARGNIVAPGVIDTHTHYDAIVHWDPNCTNSSLHGTTSVVVGNCGFGFSPCRPEDRDRYMAMMETTEQVPLAAMQKALPWDWETFPEWMEQIKRKSLGINMASYLPLNALMIYVMGIDAAKSRRANDVEMAEMKRLLNEAMDCGAIGFAFSILGETNSHVDYDGTPMPSDVMAAEDAFELAAVLSERKQGVIQCLCDIPGGVDNRHVAEELARVSGRPVFHNVIVAFDMMPGLHADRVAWVTACRDKGLDIYSMSLCFRAWNQFNADDYNAWNSTPIFREFSTQASKEAKLALLADADYRARLRDVYAAEEMYAAGGPLESFILVDACGLPEYEAYLGRTVREIAADFGVHVADAFMDLNLQTGLAADFATGQATSQDPEKVGEILDNPAIMAGTSDGGAHVKFYTGGQYSTDLINWLVQEQERYSLEQMHHKLSALPANAVGFFDRGTLEAGKAADIIVYDYDQLGFDRNNYSKAYDLPDGSWRRECIPSGMSWVIVNGVPLYRDNVFQGNSPGQILRN